MENRGPIHFEFSESSLIVTLQGITPSQKKLTYVRHPHLRDLARKMVNLIVTEHGKELFPYLCSRCGNCCRDREIVILQQEIETLARHLGLSSLETRQRFIEPATTWNIQDGILKKPDGTCVFLHHGPSGMATCSIYEVKPSFCDILSPPSMDICMKNLGILIDELEKITIYLETMIISTKGGTSVKTLLHLPLLRSMIDHIERLAMQAGEYSHEKQEIMLQHGDPLVVSLDEHDNVFLECNSPVQTLPGRVTERESLPIENDTPGRQKIEERSFTPESVRGSHTTASSIRGLRLLPDHLELITASEHRKEHLTVYYRENPAILEKIRNLYQSFTRNLDNGLLLEFFKGNRHCFRCGECCSTLRIEISLRDIQHLADHHGMTVVQMRERFLQPALHSWDEQSGCLNRKVESAGDTKGCVFLGSLGIPARCTVYGARPEVCRIYIPDKEMCLRRNREKVEQMPGPARVDIIDGTVHLLTRYREREGLPPCIFPLFEVPELMNLYILLEKELKIIFFSGAA